MMTDPCMLQRGTWDDVVSADAPGDIAPDSAAWQQQLPRRGAAAAARQQEHAAAAKQQVPHHTRLPH